MKHSFWSMVTILIGVVMPMAAMADSVEVKQDVFYLNGKPEFALTADYPYYRDHKEDWSDQLDNLKKMGVRIVTFYIPWRHHANVDPWKGGKYDFTGERLPRTDVSTFIRLIHEKGMYCIVKPGPYIHGETRNGGLPDYVIPDSNRNLIEGRKTADGKFCAAPFAAVVPGPLDPEYLRYVKDWLGAVDREVIRPFQYPAGPIIAVQILNEGVYSVGPAAIKDINYEMSVLPHFHKYLEEVYGNIDDYNRINQTAFKRFEDVGHVKQWDSPKRLSGIRKFIDWAGFGAYFHKTICRTYTSYMPNLKIPVYVNMRPPYGVTAGGIETYMSRFNYYDLRDVVHYGFTNWCGLVPYNKEAFDHYRITAKIHRGVNMEENWGFESYDAPHYWKTQPSFFQSMAYMAWGAVGLNIYLGVSTDEWEWDLADNPGSVYMSNHPIAEDKTYRNSFWTVHQMNTFLNNEGTFLVRDDDVHPIAWGFYRPYAHFGAWNVGYEDCVNAGLRDVPRAGSHGWNSFLDMCAEGDIQNDIVYIDLQPVDDLLKHNILFLNGADWMDRSTQQKLVEYVERGGTLVLNSYAPIYDENFNECTLLRDALFFCPSEKIAIPAKADIEMEQGAARGRAQWYNHHYTMRGDAVPLAQSTVNGRKITCAYKVSHGAGSAIMLGWLPFLTYDGLNGNAGLIPYLARDHAGVASPSVAGDEAHDPLVDVEEFVCAGEKSQYVYVLTRKDKPAEYGIYFTDENSERRRLRVHLTSYTAALVGIQKGNIRSALIKNVNDHENMNARPSLKLDEFEFSADAPADIVMSRYGNVYTVNAANVDPVRTRITVPISADTILDITRVSSKGRREKVEWSESGPNSVFGAIDMKYWDGGNRNTPRAVNHARDATVRTSSQESGELSGANVVDGKLRETRWSSAHRDDQWVEISFKERATMNAVRIHWEAAFAREYSVMVSAGDGKWREIFKTDNETGGKRTIRFDEQPVQQIKIMCNKRATEWGFSLYEVEALSLPASDDPDVQPEWCVGYFITVKP